MPKNREDEKSELSSVMVDLESLLESYEDEKPESSRVEVSLELLLKGAKKGYTIDELVDDLDEPVVAAHLPVLLDAGANPDNLVARLNDKDIVHHLDELLAAGAKIDIDELVGRLTPKPIADNLDKLRAAGAKINIARLLTKVSSTMVRDNFGQFLRAGADPDKLMERCDDVRVLGWYVDELVAAGAKIDVNLLASRLFRRDAFSWARNRRRLSKYVEKFLSAGMDPEHLICVLNDSGMRYWLKNDTIELLATATGVDSDEIRARLHR